MDQRIVEFIRTLRAAGVRISVAESYDAMNAVDKIGVHDRETFRYSLRTTLIKESDDLDSFDHFFPVFFDTAAPPMFNMEQELSPDQQQMLQQALQSLMGNEQALQQMLQQLMQQLMQGQGFSQEQLEQMARQAGLPNADNIGQEGYYSRMMQRMAGMQQLQQMLDNLEEALREMGMSEENIQEIMDMLEQNREALAEQIGRYVGKGIADNIKDEYETQPPDDRNLMDTPFQYLSQSDMDKLRDEVKRLAARLRSRAALRQRRDKIGDPDPKTTLRANLRYGGVPLELKYRSHHHKPKLVLICDISTSMRPSAEFLLTLIYMLQDQVSKTHSFIFIDDIREITHYFKEQRPDIAVQNVLNENPPGHYNTDLGNSLSSFFKDHLGTVDNRTSVIILGDGRNNYNDPRIDLANDLKRRARRVIWFNPEGEGQWGTGDSDMHQYAPAASGVYMVRNLAQLVEAIDNIMADS
ncbi:MAG: VWA domain-containing protein [Anaerolineae bacterium]|nr:VWA domain-containing protein [Anaerolineae bacterium]